MPAEINTSEVIDAFANSQKVDLQSVLRQIFLIDGRIYNHYRLLCWFPAYMRYVYRSQLLLMDNNDRGENEFMDQIENEVFPKHINYYLAIMAVSCY